MILVMFAIAFVLYVLSTLPLYFAIKFLGGKTTMLKTAFVNAVVWIVVYSIKRQFGILSGLFAFLVTVILYREFFKLKWIKAFFVWLFQGIFIFIFWLLSFMLNLLFGIGIFLALFKGLI